MRTQQGAGNLYPGELAMFSLRTEAYIQYNPVSKWSSKDVTKWLETWRMARVARIFHGKNEKFICDYCFAQGMEYSCGFLAFSSRNLPSYLSILENKVTGKDLLGLTSQYLGKHK